MNPASLDQVLAFLFRPQGRIGRTEYGLGIVLIYSLMLAILAFIVARGEIAGGAAFLTILATLPLTVGMLVLVAKRCHDIGLPGTFLLLLFVPVAGFVWLVALFFIPGANGPNAYGLAPQFRRE